MIHPQQATTAQTPQTAWPLSVIERTINDPVAVFTLALVISTILLWRATLRLAKEARETAVTQAEKMERSVTAANQTAVAATEQVKIAQETAYRELRAYIGIEPSIQYIGTQIISGEIRVQNAGLTPARFKLFVGTWIGPFPITALPTEAPAPVCHGQHNPFVNARDSETVPWFHPSDPAQNEAAGQELANMIANGGTRSFYIYGRVEFTDLLSRSRTLNFAYRRHGVVVAGQPFELIPLTFGNSYSSEAE